MSRFSSCQIKIAIFKIYFLRVGAAKHRKESIEAGGTIAGHRLAKEKVRGWNPRQGKSN